MKNKTLLIALVAIIMTLTALICLGSVSANEEMVVYVSANGTGDGSTPEAPIGNASVTGSIYDKAGAVVATFENTPYADAVAKLAQLQAEGQATLLDKQNILRGANALYRAFQALNGKTGTIVIVGKTAIDVADRMETNVQGPFEFRLPSNQGVVTITSNYNGVDYAKTNGAKFVLDRSVWNTINVELGCKTVWENLTIEHSAATSQSGNWPTNGSIYCSGFDTVFGEGITTTSWNAKDNKAGGSFIFVFAGKRYGQVSTDADGQQLTIKSGLWHGVFASGCGMTTANEHGKVTGNVTIDITNSGKGTATNVVTLGAGGYTKRNSAGVIGDVTFNVSSNARIQNSIYAQSGAGVSGNVVINIAKDAILSEKVVFRGVYYTDGQEKLYTPTSVKLNFYKSSLDETKIFSKADFEGGNNEYNVLDATPTPPPSDSGTGTPTVTDGVVVYVANVAKGKGDGSSPENALGHAVDYDKTAAKAHMNHAFYLALTANDNALITKGGIIVIVDELSIDHADARRASFSEFQWPGADGSKNITITSYYNGVDYRATGAKLVLDTTLYGINWRIKAPTTWEYLDIEAKYNSSISYGKSVDGVAMISFYGNKTVINREVNVTSNDTAVMTQYYPTLTAGDRMGTGANAVVEGNTDLTINCGTWGRVFGSNYGMRTGGGDQYGARKGNVNITVNGGKVGEIYGTTYTNTNFNFGLDGNVTIKLNGGEVNTVYASSPLGVTGKIDVTVDKSVTGLEKVWGYAYAGNFAAPTDATITYDRSNLSDDKVMYFTTVNAIGEAPIAPPETGADVVYISANGTGDGSSADKPLGNAAGYVAADHSYLNNAFYLAFKALGENGGTIVVVDDVVLDSVESRFPTKEGEKLAPSEFQMPKHIKGTVVVTSVYCGVDYRAQNDAKLVLDLDACNTQFITFYNAVTLKDLDVEHKYDPNDINGWGTAFAFAANGYAFTVDEGVNVTSLNADTNAAGDFYPMIIGGHRYLNIVGRTPSVTVKSGTWDTVIAGSYGMGGTDKTYGTYGNVDADVNLTIEGGRINKVFVTGPDRAASASGTVFGKATVNVTGGEIESFYFSHIVEYKGTGSVVNFGANSKVAFADYALKNYKGSLDELKTKVTFNIENGVELGKEPEKAPVVIYISANGTGDGSSPEAPLGNDPGYVAGNKSFYGLAFYKAFEKLKNDKGIIVVVGDTQIDSVESRFEHDANGKSKAPSELTMPVAGGKVIITSVYGGVDYRANAKLILDQATCATTFLTFRSDVTFENIDIEHKYDPDDLNGWGTPYVIAANGNELVIGKNVNVTSLNADTGKEGALYPMLLGGHRYNRIKTGVSLTVESGKWSTVIAGSYGLSANYPGLVEGDAVLNIKGGQIETVLGTSSLDRAFGLIQGKLEINITGGRVEKLYATASNGAENEIVVNIAETAEYVGMAWGSVSGDSVPTNATINYPRSVISDSNVKYWTRNEGSGEQKGDVNGDGMVNADDAILLVYHALFPNEYYVKADCDFDGSGIVNIEDAIYLLYHLFFAEDFPLA